LDSILKNKVINEWRFFWLISVPMSAVIFMELMGTDLATAAGVSHMIGFAVRFAVPLIFLVVAASAVHNLFPGPLSVWWVRNRKYIGMCFAVAMAWQGLFIFMMSNFFRSYYFEEIYLFRDELEGTTGYIFLTAMVVTSFQFGRKFLSQKQWKLLHRVGIYFLWAYPFSTYWWTVGSYYGEPGPIDYFYYWMGFVAFALRIAAWGNRRLHATRKQASEYSTPPGVKVLGGAVIVVGLAVAAIGPYWHEAVTAFLTTPAWSANLELWFPFWPYEPFLSLFIIGLGTSLYTRTRSDA